MNKLEDVFKKSLENAEAPYDAKVWDSMASRLNQVMPTTQVKGSFKWAWIAGFVLVAGSAALFLVSQNTNKQQAVNSKSAQNKVQNSIKEVRNSKLVSTSDNALIENDGNETIKSIAIVESKQTSPKYVFTNQNNTASAIGSNKSVTEVKPKSSPEATVESIYPIEVVRTVKEVKVAAEERISKEAVNAKIDFSASTETFYEKGLPFNSLTSNVNAKKYEWTNERGEVLSTDKNADIHLFTSGMHSITLAVEFSNGDIQRVTKDVRCDLNYNLLAVTGFNPASSDFRNSTFIPFALLKSERNISFDMQIIDIKTGQVVFETNNADMPWDGMDLTTNQMVPANSTFIWRVNIHEKAKGEPTNRYQGTITRI
jgi:hypothetical protein